VRCSIGQALALHAFKRQTGPLLIFDTKRGAIAVAEIELCQIAVQVVFRTVLILVAHNPSWHPTLNQHAG
jgi:hypothetical protein